MSQTNIAWTDFSWNPIRAIAAATPGRDGVGWHCERVSEGCRNCYAEVINEKRFGTGLAYTRPNRDRVDIYLDESTLAQPLHWRKPRRVFVCSMTDLFGEWVTDAMLDRVFAVMAAAPQHTFQLLTKRPERMRRYVSAWVSNSQHPGAPNELDARWDAARRWLLRPTTARWGFASVSA